jgi:immunoglobulin I-set domain protein
MQWAAVLGFPARTWVLSDRRPNRFTLLMGCSLMRRSNLALLLVIIMALAFVAMGCAGVTTGKTGGNRPVMPSIATQPANQAVTAGQPATFSVVASGTAPLSYQWRKNSASISGAVSASYTTPAATSADNGAKFDVVVTNSAGSVTSAQATLTVNAAATAPSITTPPANQTVTAGQTATFSVVASGTAPLSYQWRKNSTNVSGATAASYTTPATTTADNNAKFDVVVANSTGSATSTPATLTVNSVPTAPSITTQPSNQTVTAGQTATFSVVATGTAPLSFQWQNNAADIAGATSSSYTTPMTTIADSGNTFRVMVRNSVGSVTSNTATLTVNPSTTTSSVDVITYHYDNGRSGQNLNESTLTPANVNVTKFGKLGAFSVDGKVDAQALYLSNVAIPSVGNKNVLYVVTEHGSVYAFDADSISGSTSTFLWKKSTLLGGETTSDNRGCGQVSPEIGITATPVIDRTRGPHGTIYVVAMSKSGSNYFHRLHALDLATGDELLGGPMNITAQYPGTGDNSNGTNVIFDPKQYKERPGLLQIGGTIYTTWSSHCDIRPYTSWVIAFSADTLAQTSVLNLVPNGSEGGIWMAGTAPAADASGNIFFILGNGDFDTNLNAQGFPSNGNCGNCFVKLTTSGGLKLADYFTPHNTVAESNADQDFGSGGGILLVDVVDSGGTTRHLSVGAGKDSLIYVVNRDSMGKFNSTTDQIYQEISGQLGGGVFSMPAYFNGTVYYGAVGDALKAFPIINGKLKTTPATQSTHHFGYPGTTPAVSANGTTNGIVWAVDNAGTLYAFDAADLTKVLYDSSTAPNGRDSFSGNKFITPMIANGKVYVGTPNSVAVFGLLP